MLGLPSLKIISKVLFFTLTIELITPCVSFALSSGPTQPEVSSFEPVGTTDMVDLFTGDFVYNIPLLDVDGYPVNISYHGGIDMEQEASWVGLGWNINPGVIGRSMRGLPDDMNGDVIEKTVNIKKEESVTVGTNAGAEFAGVGEPLANIGGNLGATITHSNYRGYSIGLTMALNASVGYGKFKPINSGINIGVNSATGADIDYNIGASLSSGMVTQSDIGIGIGITRGQGYNSRSAAKDKYESISGRITYGGKTLLSASATKVIPIGINNIVPVITNASTMKIYKGRIKVGGEFYSVFPYGGVNGMYTTLEHDKNGNAKGYGFFYSQNADDTSIHDFTRDKDGNFNETMKYLPLSTMTYDLYSASAQGNGGSFRPFRNDLGTIYDPVLKTKGNEYNVAFEGGIGNLFEIGTDYTYTETVNQSGPWKQYQRNFTSKKSGSNYEPFYFKAAGELTATNSIINSLDAVDGIKASSFPQIIQENVKERVARGNLLHFFTNDVASKNGVATLTQLESYPSNTFIQSVPDYIDRNTGNRKPHQIGEIIQTQTDGTRYVYSIPAMNNIQEELVFAVQPTTINNGLVSYSSQDISVNNENGRDNYFSKTTTPSFAHSFLLTSVLSNDYVDIKGDGPTDDDYGVYKKFNYTRKNASYGWKSPFQPNMAQYNPGLKSDLKDDKATLVKGTKEIWMLHSIETKNSIAEFYTSGRKDAFGINVTDSSYQLDSIILYNKNDRLQNMSAAKPIKTIIFHYNYELCPNTPNSKASNGGKLTLKSIYTKYGTSDKGLISPYIFEYNATSNFSYDVACKNRWGGYKPNNTTKPNHEFPFVDWQDENQDLYARAWMLSSIKLPSGGTIEVQYESDDYAYVQDKPAMDIHFIEGVGNTKDFIASNILYNSKKSPNLYLYFKRDKLRENTNKNIRENYLGNKNQLLVNVDIDVAHGRYEGIKSYAEVVEVGYCNENSNSDYGYIKIKAIDKVQNNPNILLNPITYQSLNYARYYMPETLYGSRSGTTLGDLKGALNELLNIFKNPILTMIDAGKGKRINLSTSYMRLNNVARIKKGGGHRVKQIVFLDEWDKMSNPNNFNQSIGKEYHYTKEENGRTISSGVASYEPALGNDDNPFKEPYPYITQKGSIFPPSDAIGLYQEAPLGESLYPSPQVGYSLVTMTSIHKEYAPSGQTIETTEFYTAADFPIRVYSSELNNIKDIKDAKYNKQEIIYQASQGYSLVFNDMHGKLKRTEKRIAKAGTNLTELVSYQTYNYFPLGSEIPVMEFDTKTNNFVRLNKVLGQEADMTIDTREKIQESNAKTYITNFNFFIVGIYPVPLYLGFPLLPTFKEYMYNNFSSVVATKIIQQYGILKSIESYNEGAITLVKNEVFNAYTGQPLVTSVNNEYNDIEHTVAIPAYLAYSSLGPSYQNIGYTDHFSTAHIIENQAFLSVGDNVQNYKIGDELLMQYTDGGSSKIENVWVMDIVSDTTGLHDFIAGQFLNGYGGYFKTGCDTPKYKTGYQFDSTYVQSGGLLNTEDGFYKFKLKFPNNIRIVVQPRYLQFKTGGNRTIQNVSILNIRSGYKNKLQDAFANFSALEDPFQNNRLKLGLNKALNATVTEYSNANVAVLNRYDSSVNTDFDTLNQFLSGVWGQYAPYKNYIYLKNRVYGNLDRNNGIFEIIFPWRVKNRIYPNNLILASVIGEINCWDTYTNISYLNHAMAEIYPLYMPKQETYFELTTLDPNWIKSSYITKRSPYGHDLEELSSLGIYSTAVFGYNNTQPIGIVNNARQNEVFFDGFEDYSLMQTAQNIVFKNNSLLGQFESMGYTSFLLNNIMIPPSSKYYKYNLTNNSNYEIVSSTSHSGNNALKTKSNLNIPLSFINIVDTGIHVTGKWNNTILFTNKKYLVSLWYKPVSSSSTNTTYNPPNNFNNVSRIIDGWQKAERIIQINTPSIQLINLNTGLYIDDIRIIPMDASAKGFVYNPWNNRLVATLDENNYCTFYEYDLEGKLLRTKKETEKGIMTINESRSAHPKK